MLNRSGWPRVIVVSVLLTLIILVGIAFWPSSTRLNSGLLLQSAKDALAVSDYALAESLVNQVEVDDPAYADSRLIAGECATRGSQPERAIEYYAQIRSSSKSEYVVGLYATAELYRGLCRWSDAIQTYEKVLEQSPEHTDCRQRLAFLLGASGQRWQSADHLLTLVKQQAWTVESLAILSDIERPVEQLEMVKSCFEQHPEDPVIQLARAAHYAMDGETNAARAILEPLIKRYPELIAAHEQLGEILVLLGDGSALSVWQQRLPSSAELSPTVWYVRAQMAKKGHDLELAAGSLARVLQLAPEHRQGTYQLGQQLTRFEDPSAKLVIQRAEIQAEMGQQLDKILASDGRDAQALELVATNCHKLGRYWEAWAWAVTAIGLHGKLEWAVQLQQSCQQQLKPDLPRTAIAFQPTKVYPLDRWLDLATKARIDRLVLSHTSGNTQASSFANESAKFHLEESIGLDFAYFNGADEATPGARMFEQTGGGVAVIDYDNDGWPDLYFSQGAKWVTGELACTQDGSIRDCLFRNEAGRKFQDVSLLAGIEELQYSQGVSVGDLNNDGFSDLIVGNVGGLRVFVNNGDGTFLEQTDNLPDLKPTWSTSVMLADLNFDGWEDIYQVAYVHGKDVYTLICQGKGCSPSMFEGTANQCWLSNGDGSFTKLTRADGDQRFSKSLGVLAFLAEGTSTPSLFIANDQVRNFLLTSSGAIENDFHFEDEALERGLALNVDGLAFASMGVAADDVDNNGTVDLLVTNFSEEPNSLYLQDQSGLFVDASGASSMQSASYAYVGWGTQFIDVDRDSWVDTVIAYGHIDDYSDRGKGYKMSPQLYRNRGANQLDIVSPEIAGDYFQNQYLGRGLAKLDWNRDGLVDFAVSNINSPACLVSNSCTGAGNYLDVHLVGTTSARQPIGSIISVRSGDRLWKKQLMGGDGYQCCNEKKIQFGLGDVSQIDEVEVIWPSGSVEKFTGVAANTAVLLIEASNKLTVIAR